jgi:hypothetical protein
MEEVGRGPSCFCSDIVAGRIGGQHEPICDRAPGHRVSSTNGGVGMHRRGGWGKDGSTLGIWVFGIWAIVKLEKVEGKGPAGAVYVSVDVCVL